jgi:acyl carrier protein
MQLGSTSVRADDRIVSDLGAESLDVLNIVVAVEERFGVRLDEERLPAIVTVKDLYDEIANSA